ncbi:Density-regulated protein homolog [Geodia barretti]|uniref:Density-regulated protein homolog n=1 Tax=Geodia barretti TaxID=519541 RepID=A0AA35S4W4_GEOBA|nr:Density-regulated protein homolog [Geodia barretti]
MAEDDAASFPLAVDYCGVCSMPPEYCEYSADPSKCYEWMKVNLPDHYSRIEAIAAQLEGVSVGEGKRQTRGGKAMKKVKIKEESVKRLCISRSQRAKRKCVTVIVGLKSFDIELKKASRLFAGHFSCGSSVTGDDEVVVQGDVYDGIVDFIKDKWPQVTEDHVKYMGDQKR